AAASPHPRLARKQRSGGRGLGGACAAGPLRSARRPDGAASAPARVEDDRAADLARGQSARRAVVGAACPLLGADPPLPARAATVATWARSPVKPGSPITP